MLNTLIYIIIKYFELYSALEEIYIFQYCFHNLFIADFCSRICISCMYGMERTHSQSIKNAKCQKDKVEL